MTRDDWRERALRAEQLSADAAELAAPRGVALLEAQDALTSLRSSYATLVHAQFSSSDNYRMRVYREALARVEGWGM